MKKERVYWNSEYIMDIDVRQTDNGHSRNFCSHDLSIPLSRSSYFDNYWERSSEGRRRSPMESIGEAESDVKTSRGKFRETPTSKRNNRSSKKNKIEITCRYVLTVFDTTLRFVSRRGSMNECSRRRLSRHIGRWGCLKSLSSKTSTEIEAKEGKIARDPFYGYSELKK